jgi:hypothetical protein
MRAAWLLTEGAMEDEGLVDDDFIDDTARAYVARFGAAAAAMLRERAAIADAAGAALLALAWRDMADAAELLWLEAAPADGFAP